MRAHPLDPKPCPFHNEEPSVWTRGLYETMSETRVECRHKGEYCPLRTVWQDVKDCGGVAEWTAIHHWNLLVDLINRKFAAIKKVEEERDELLGLIRNLKAAKDRWDELETIQCGMDCDEWAKWSNDTALAENRALSALFAKLPSADGAKETT